MPDKPSKPIRQADTYHWVPETALEVSPTAIDMVSTHRSFGALSDTQRAAAVLITMYERVRDTHPSMVRELSAAITLTQQGALMAQHAERKYFLFGHTGG